MYILLVFDVSFIVPYLLICVSCTARADVLSNLKSLTSICGFAADVRIPLQLKVPTS